MGTNVRPWLAALFLLALVSVNCGLAQPIIDRVRSSDVLARLGAAEPTSTPRREATPRPTFTPTPDYTATPSPTATFTVTPIPSDTPTPPPTNTPVPTDTPAPTDTPVPTNTLPPPTPAPPTDTPTPAPSPTPDFPFALIEQGNREFQHTNYNVITIYTAITDPNNIPIGGLKLIANHSSGKTVESGLSDWRWSVVNCLNCNYVKQGNLKFEPGLYEDGTWEIYLADKGGTQLSQKVALSYSSSPEQWVWDFLLFKKK